MPRFVVEAGRLNGQGSALVKPPQCDPELLVEVHAFDVVEGDGVDVREQVGQSARNLQDPGRGR